MRYIKIEGISPHDCLSVVQYKGNSAEAFADGLADIRYQVDLSTHTVDEISQAEVDKIMSAMIFADAMVDYALGAGNPVLN